MQVYYLDNEKYYYNNGKWMTRTFTEAPLAIVNRLNQLLVNETDLGSKSMEELISVIDGARKADNIQLAAKALEAALEIATVHETRNLLPRLTSNYRKLGQSQKAIDVCKSYTDRFNKAVWSPALFTSVAAAYCDVEDYETARKFANLARSLSGPESAPELISVYKRIKEAEN